jgi:sugar O-acyltransferase (sialic acid O-acetyltransferase NeuD family)
MRSAKPIVIVGSGGFGREVLDLLRALDPGGAKWQFEGFVSDDQPDAGQLERIGARWLGTCRDFLADPAATCYTVGIASPVDRRRIVNEFDGAGLTPVTLIHPTALIGSDTDIGEGTVLCAFVSVTTSIHIGRHVHLDRGTTVGHDSILEDFVTIHPSAVVSGSVLMRSGVRMGTTACILPNVTIGRDAIIGAGAVVTKNVESGQVVMGVPARPTRG